MVLLLVEDHGSRQLRIMEKSDHPVVHSPQINLLFYYLFIIYFNKFINLLIYYFLKLL